jgi:hypothetical protein
MLDEVGAGRLVSADDLEDAAAATERAGDPLSLAPSAGGLPLPPEPDRPSDRDPRDG